MEYLPKDPAILVSSINMLLRDEEFDTLESLCYSFSREPEEIKEYLIKNDYVYSEEQKQFRPVGYNECSLDLWGTMKPPSPPRGSNIDSIFRQN